MATVYRAYDPSFDRVVALKLLPREFLHNPQFHDRFKREIKTVARLEHPAIVPVYDVGEIDGQPYFVMRYMAGGSLTDWIQSGKHSLQDTARVVERLADALDYAHKKGVIHRDLKPANILFDDNGDPFISDFGVAKLEQADSTLTGDWVVGTPEYMSPEQAQSGQVDSRSDIYALGAILYQALVGKRPFEADTPMGVIYKHVNEPVPDILTVLPTLPRQVDTIIKTAMAKEKENRYANAFELARDLNLVVSGNEGTILSPSGTRMGKPPVGLNVRKPGFLIGGVILLAVLLVAFLFRNRLFGAAQPVSTPVEISTGVPPVSEINSTQELPTAVSVPGGADKIAILSAKEIWIMNLDGSDPVQLTNSSSGKSQLQWLPDGKSVLYLSGTCAYAIDTETQELQTISCFSPAKYLEGFRVSPDGKSVAISLNRELIIVPFDPAKLRAAQNKSDLVAMENSCLYNQAATKGVRWSDDGQQLAVSYVDTSSRSIDRIRLLDISGCETAGVVALDEFPAGDFILKGYKYSPAIPSFDWDGERFFLLNDDVRNGGFGNLYLYDTITQEGKLLNPVEDTCCYRDARWSPDGKYVLLLFQDMRQAEQSTNQLYYIPFEDLQSGRAGSPIQLPIQFFASPREHPQSALRPVR